MADDQDRQDRLSAVTSAEFRPRSLVGSFFHSDSDRGWQGCVVAEPAPGVYLVELFEWLAGSSTNQCLVSIDDMGGWQFYDTADWMTMSYTHEVERRWERERRDREGE